MAIQTDECKTLLRITLWVIATGEKTIGTIKGWAHLSERLLTEKQRKMDYSTSLAVVFFTCYGTVGLTEEQTIKVNSRPNQGFTNQTSMYSAYLQPSRNSFQIDLAGSEEKDFVELYGDTEMIQGFAAIK